jgi:OOP family OmpA-OmpF porin
MKKMFTLFISGALLATSITAFAGNKEDQFSISALAGGISFDGKQHLESHPVVGLRLGYNFTKAFGVEGLFDYANTEGTISDSNVDFFRYGGEMLYHFMPDNKFVPFVAAGYAAVNFKHDTATNSAKEPVGAFDYGAGMKYFFMDDVALRGDVRHLIYENKKTLHAVEYTLGLYFPFGGATPAAKPVEPPPAPAKVEVPPPAPVKVEVPPPAPAKVEVPPPAPTSSLTVTPAKITKGQPATLAWTSKNAAKCDIQPGIGPVQPQGTMSITPESDTNYTIDCSGAGGSTTSKAGIAVIMPPPVVEAPKAPAAKLCQPTVLDVNFDTNKADIKPEFNEELNKLGEFLKEFPNATGTIEGHTDNVGDKASNMKLSQRRADSIRNYIIKNFGIAPERIKAKGYGLTKPVADNKTKEGKAKNRRIEANFKCE